MPTKEMTFRLLPNTKSPHVGDLVRHLDTHKIQRLGDALTLRQFKAEKPEDWEVVHPLLLQKSIVMVTSNQFNEAHIKAIENGRLKDNDVVKVKVDDNGYPKLKFDKVVMLHNNPELYTKEQVVNAMHLFHLQHKGSLASKDKIRDWFDTHATANML